MSDSKTFICNKCNRPCKIEISDDGIVRTPTQCVYNNDHVEWEEIYMEDDEENVSP